MRAIEVVLRPNPELVGRTSMRADRIWGEPITLSNVTLERYDLDLEGSQSSP